MKTSKLRVTGLCVRNSPVTGEFPAQMASDAEIFPFDGVIMATTPPSRHVIPYNPHQNEYPWSNNVYSNEGLTAYIQPSVKWKLTRQNITYHVLKRLQAFWIYTHKLHIYIILLSYWRVI